MVEDNHDSECPGDKNFSWEIGFTHYATSENLGVVGHRARFLGGARAGYKNIPPAIDAGGESTENPPQGCTIGAALPCGGGSGLSVTKATIWT